MRRRIRWCRCCSRRLVAAVAFEDDGVDCAEGGGDGVDIVEVGDDELLARVGDVECVVSERAGPGEHLADAGGGDAQGVEVQRAVDVVEALGAALSHMQRGGQ